MVATKDPWTILARRLSDGNPRRSARSVIPIEFAVWRSTTGENQNPALVAIFRILSFYRPLAGLFSDAGRRAAKYRGRAAWKPPAPCHDRT